MGMDNVICEFKGATGTIALYNDRAVVSHHGIGASMNGCNKKNNITIMLDQIERMQFKYPGIDGGFIQFTVKGDNRVFHDIHDITKDENCVIFGIAMNKNAERFKYQLAHLIPNIPINILKKSKDIHQFNQICQNEIITPYISNIQDSPKEQREINSPIATQQRQTEKVYYNNASVQDNVCCPKCHSTSLSVGKKGYSFGFAFLGFLVFGALSGLFLGGFGIIIGIIFGIICGGESSKKIRITCLKCGHKFYPGKK
jgi:hypothetical protein